MRNKSQKVKNSSFAKLNQSFHELIHKTLKFDSFLKLNIKFYSILRKIIKKKLYLILGIFKDVFGEFKIH